MLMPGLIVSMLLLAALGWRQRVRRERRAGRSRARRRRNLAHQTLWDQVFARQRPRRLSGPAAEAQDISSAD